MIKVLGSLVAMRPIFPSDMIGSLYVPDIAKDRANQGIVKYIGPKVMELKPGDHVLFSGYSGSYIQLEGEGLLITMPERYISAIIHPPETEVPGLYFQSTDGLYFQATYEMAMELIGQAVMAADWYTGSRDGKRRFECISQQSAPVTFENDEED